MKEILVAQVLVDPYEGKTPPFEDMVPDQEKDVGQIRDLTDDELKDMGITLLDNKCPVFLYFYKYDILAGEMGSRRFESVEEVKEFFKDRKHVSIGGKFHTIQNSYVIRYKEFESDYDSELSKLVIDNYLSYKKLVKKLNTETKYDSSEHYIRMFMVDQRYYLMKYYGELG